MSLDTHIAKGGKATAIFFSRTYRTVLLLMSSSLTRDGLCPHKGSEGGAEHSAILQNWDVHFFNFLQTRKTNRTDSRSRASCLGDFPNLKQQIKPKLVPMPCSTQDFVKIDFYSFGYSRRISPILFNYRSSKKENTCNLW